ncbi:MAG: acyltransferase, partial [Clostridia bacterium]|nr:acyltransferase [Clostridia bacterium]
KCNLISHESIIIGNDTILAQNIFIYDHDHKYDAENGVKKREFKTAPIVIGKNCWIGANTMILRGTEIGDNCVIGAGCILKGKYPKGSLIIQPRETVVRPIENLNGE